MVGVMLGRSPHGERGLKYLRHSIKCHGVGRSPHGERGLKYRRMGGIKAEGDVALLMESVD